MRISTEKVEISQTSPKRFRQGTDLRDLDLFLLLVCGGIEEFSAVISRDGKEMIENPSSVYRVGHL